MNANLSLSAMDAQKRAEILEPDIKEANLIYFAFMLACSLVILLIPALYGIVGYDASVSLAIVFMLISIPLFCLGHHFSKKNFDFIAKNKHNEDSTECKIKIFQYKVWYYAVFVSLTLSILFSALAITSFYNVVISLDGMALAVGGAVLLSILDVLVLSTGKRERTFFTLMIIPFLGAITWSIYVLVGRENLGDGIPMLVFSIAMLILHLAMLCYICTGSGFFAIISFSYLFFAAIALIVAILIAGEGDCSCDSCDCVSFQQGGRRNRVKNLKGTVDAVESAAQGLNLK